MRRVLMSRRWIVLTAVVLAAVAVMVSLGFWQLRRLHSVRQDNARVRARLALPVASVETVLSPSVDPSSVAFRRVSVTGRYDRVAEILLQNRSFNGDPGSHVLTPLRMQDGRGVIVDRGFVPLDMTAREEEQARPPLFETVSIIGELFPSDRKGVFSPAIPSTGRLTTIPRVDVPRIAKQLGYPVEPLYLRLESQTPAQPGPLPVPPELPDLTEGPHLSYAVQWFLFAAVALATYVALQLKATRKPAG